MWSKITLDMVSLGLIYSMQLWEKEKKKEIVHMQLLNKKGIELNILN